MEYDIAKINFIFGIISVVSIFVSVIFFLLSGEKELKEEDIKRIEKEKSSFSEHFQKIYDILGSWIYWIANKMSFAYNLNPNVISLLGLLSGIIGSILIIPGFFSAGGILIILGGIFDVVDGKVAREKRQERKTGALTDSVLDRISEIFMFSSLLIFFEFRKSIFFSVLSALSMAFSLLVSYVRARGESLGVKVSEGSIRRPERVTILSISLILESLSHFITGKIIFIPLALIVIFIGSVITSIDRFRKVFKELEREETKDK
jgi:phosphatidylglycerophosphate synthase